MSRYTVYVKEGGRTSSQTIAYLTIDTEETDYQCANLVGGTSMLPGRRYALLHTINYLFVFVTPIEEVEVSYLTWDDISYEITEVNQVLA